ncbi:hypothetical protein E1H99_02660 [Enterococcus hirae]|nr:hypothetical protein E1H99_02660 [Enterococcus hirae]
MSAGILLLMLSSLFFIWTIGLSNPVASFLYENSSPFVTFGIFILAGLNLYKARGFDFFYLVVAIATFGFYTYFTDVRGSSFYGNLLIPLIVLLGLSVKWIEFDRLDRAIYLLVFSLFLSVTLYRIFTEIQIPEGQSLWKPDNKLSDIWINTNTIGSSLMMLGLLISGFASSFERWYIRILSIPAIIAAFLGIWVCQSRSALIAMLLFAFLDCWPKKLFKIIRAPFIGYLAIIGLALPISYLAATSEKVNIFTGREDIWLKFYETIGEKSQQVFVGMKPFIYQRGNEFLGNHNSYNSILNLYGLVGIGITGVLLLVYIGRLTLKADLSNGQLTFLWAFLAVMAQSFMEDTLTSFPWVPIVYLLLAMASNRYDNSPKKKRDKKNSTVSSLSRAERYH